MCRLCEFFDPGVAESCREPIAEEVNDKEKSNFCEYFQATPVTQPAGASPSQSEAAAGLAALFGESAAAALSNRPEQRRAARDEAKEALDSLFGLDSDHEEE